MDTTLTTTNNGAENMTVTAKENLRLAESEYRAARVEVVTAGREFRRLESRLALPASCGPQPSAAALAAASARYDAARLAIVKTGRAVAAAQKVLAEEIGPTGFLGLLGFDYE